MPASRVNFNPKWLKSEKVKVAQSVSSSLPPRGLYSPWNSPGQNPGVGSRSLLQGDLPNPGIELESPALQEDSLTSEPPGKPYFKLGCIYLKNLITRLHDRGCHFEMVVTVNCFSR